MKRLYDEPAAYSTADIANALMNERDRKLPVRPSFFDALVPQVSAKDAAVNRPILDETQRGQPGVISKLLIGGAANAAETFGMPGVFDPSGDIRNQSWGNALKASAWLPADTAKSAYDAVVDPSRAASGEMSPKGGVYQDELGNYVDETGKPLSEYRDEMLSSGLNIAGTAAMTGSIAPKPRNAAGMFGGRLAKTADHAALARAEELAAKGAPREDIWSQTGWFKGVDGKWRFEIDDSKLGLRGEFDGYPGNNPIALKAKAGDVFSGLDDIWSAYPNLQNMKVNAKRSMSSPDNGAYVPGIMRGELELDYYGPHNIKPLAAHEIQHAVQGQEGFQNGTNPIMAKVGRLLRGDLETSSRDAYQRNSGEAEARAVEKRLHLTPEQRADRPPWLDFDVPEGQQIVGGLNYGRAMSLDTDIARQIHEAQRLANPDADPNRLAQIVKRPSDARWHKGNEWEVSSPVGNISAREVPHGVRIVESRLDDGVPKGLGYGTPLYEALANEAAASGRVMTSDMSVSPAAQRVYEGLERRGYNVRGPGEDAMYHPEIGSVIDPYQPPYVVQAPNVAPREMPPPLPDNALYANSKSSGVPGAFVAEAADRPVRAYRGVDFTRPKTGNLDSMFSSSEPRVADAYANQFDDFNRGGVLPVDVDFKNPYVVDAKGSHWTDVPHNGHRTSTEDLARFARDNGHDGLVVNNVVDVNSKREYQGPATTYAALKRGTVRSALTGDLLYANSKSSGVPGAMIAEASKRVENPDDAILEILRRYGVQQ